MSNYRNENQLISKAFKALSNPNRLAIFQRLLDCCDPGTSCEVEQCMKIVVGELGKDIEIAPSTLSHHLNELHQAELIMMERKGQHIECWVNTERVALLAGFLNQTAG